MLDQLVMDRFVDRIEEEVRRTPEAKAVLALARKRRECYRIIEDFQGPIYNHAYSLDGKWRYLPMREEDKKIIPKAAFVRHAAIEKYCCRVVQVLIGHEIPEIPITPAIPKPEVPALAPASPLPMSKPKPQVDWGNVAAVAASGFGVAMMGVAVISFYALVGALQMVDPSYCVVLNDRKRTVVEILTWNQETPNAENPL